MAQKKRKEKKTSSDIQTLKGVNLQRQEKNERQENDIVRLVLQNLVLHLEEERKNEIKQTKKILRKRSLSSTPSI